MDKGNLVILESRGILRVSGRDASSFIQGYITSDVNALTDGNWQPGAFCNLQGRMVANFRMVNRSGDLLISMDKELVETTARFLQKYIVFSKAKTTDATDNYRVLGVLGTDCQLALEQVLGSWPTADAGCTEIDGHLILSVPGELPRYEVWLNSSSAEGIIAQLAERLTLSDPEIWTLAEIRAGWSWLSAETSEQYIPQMLNLQAQDAINFKKGCYLGQEIVARMQYLGQLKRRMYRLGVMKAATKPGVGDKLHNDDGAVIGEIVMSAANNGGHEVLAVCREPGEGVLNLESGAKAEILSLPYHCVIS